jgi:MFS family permease
MSEPPNDPPKTLAYETPEDSRPASAAPTEAQLERELPVARRIGAHDPYAAMRLPVYRLFVGNYALAVIGTQVMSVAIQWELYQKTQKALTLGVLGGIQALPVIFLALIAGHASDIYSRKRVLMVTQVALVVCAAALAALVQFYRDWQYYEPTIYGVVLLNSVALAFARPARAAMLPQIVPKHIFGNAVTWNASMFEIATVLGPAIGGLIIARASVAIALAFSGLCTLVCLWLTAPLPSLPPASAGEPLSFATLVAGVRFVFTRDLMLAVMSLDLFAVLLGGATFLLPIFAQRLGVGAVGFGWLRAAPSVGAIIMAMYIAHAPPMQRAGRTLLLAVAGFGLATIVFGLSRSYWLSMAMLFLTGAFDNVSVVVRHTLVQMLTPDSMRGRVSAVNQVFIGSSNELGGLESGVTAQLFGPVISVVAGGIGTVVVVIAAAIIWPSMRKFGSLQSAEPS